MDINTTLQHCVEQLGSAIGTITDLSRVANEPHTFSEPLRKMNDVLSSLQGMGGDLDSFTKEGLAAGDRTQELNDILARLKVDTTKAALAKIAKLDAPAPAKPRAKPRTTPNTQGAKNASQKDAGGQS